MKQLRGRAVIIAALVLSACAAPVVESGALNNPPAGLIEAPAPTPATTATITSTTATSTTPATTAGPPTPPVAALTGWEAVDQYLDITVVRGGSQAVSVAVMRDGLDDHAAAFGRRVTDDPVEPQDRFRVASISKTITAITMLQLVEDGLIGLDDRVGDLVAAGLGVGEVVSGVGDVTVRHLLTHRSGFGQYEDLFFGNQVGSCRAAATVGLTQPMRSGPGLSFQYSNLNFCLLGIVIELVAGTPYEQVVDEVLLTPLGITGMRLAGTFDVGEGDVEHRSDVGRNYMEVLGAAGAWIASPDDLLGILNSLNPSTQGWKPLQAASLDVMKTVTTEPAQIDPLTSEPVESVPPSPESGYGMGLMIFGPGSYGHTGTVESTHAMFVHRPDGISWAITVSGDYPSSTRELARIMDNALLLGGFVDAGFVTVPPPIGAD